MFPFLPELLHFSVLLTISVTVLFKSVKRFGIEIVWETLKNYLLQKTYPVPL